MVRGRWEVAHPRAMIGTVARGIACLLPLCALPACFDVQHVEPGTFLIDDFEDGDPLPSAPPFSRWRCYTFNPDIGEDPEQTVSCDVEPQPGDQSAYGMFARFKLHDGTPAGVRYAGAGVGTWVDDNPAFDFNGYRAFAFKMRVELDNPPPPDTKIDVQLGCSSVKAVDPNGPQLFFDLAYYVLPGDTWQSFSLLLSDFTQRQDEMNHFADGPESCLKRVDNVRFEVSGAFTYGQSATGVIHIDDVHLE